MVGAPRFELGTSCAQGRRTTQNNPPVFSATAETKQLSGDDSMCLAVCECPQMSAGWAQKLAHSRRCLAQIRMSEQARMVAGACNCCAAYTLLAKEQWLVFLGCWVRSPPPVPSYQTETESTYSGPFSRVPLVYPSYQPGHSTFASSGLSQSGFVRFADFPDRAREVEFIHN